MKVFLVAGARPNFMKIAPIYRASLAVSGVDCRFYIDLQSAYFCLHLISVQV